MGNSAEPDGTADTLPESVYTQVPARFTGIEASGKLRLLYECNPIAFLAEQAGGKASNGKTRILDIKPASLHQRTPFYVGSKNMVSKAEAFLKICNT